MLQHLRNDLAYAIRIIRKSPLVSAVAVVSVGLGVAGIVTGFAIRNAPLALSLAALGVYGIVAFTVSRQAAEIGLRMALGARPMMIVARVARSGALLAALGLLIGTPTAFWVARAVMAIPSADIPGMGTLVPLSPITIVGVGGILIAVTLIACVIPARHAARVDPASVLREV